jgi:hypothetical protein
MARSRKVPVGAAVAAGADVAAGASVAAGAAVGASVVAAVPHAVNSMEATISIPTMCQKLFLILLSFETINCSRCCASDGGKGFVLCGKHLLGSRSQFFDWVRTQVFYESTFIESIA